MGDFKGRLRPEDEDVLIENHEELVSQLRPSELTSALFQRRVIDFDQIEQIKKAEEKNRKEGVQKLLEIIHESGVDAYQAFIESLNSVGYLRLAQTLEESGPRIRERRKREESERLARSKKFHQSASHGDHASGGRNRGKLPQLHYKILQKNYLTLCENVRAIDIVDHLFTNNLFDLEEMDRIEKKGNISNKEAMKELLSIVFNSGDGGFLLFIECLKKSHGFIAEKLQKELDDMELASV